MGKIDILALCNYTTFDYQFGSTGHAGLGTETEHGYTCMYVVPLFKVVHTHDCTCTFTCICTAARWIIQYLWLK